MLTSQDIKEIVKAHQEVFYNKTEMDGKFEELRKDYSKLQTSVVSFAVGSKKNEEGVTLANKEAFAQDLTGQLAKMFSKKQDKVTNWSFYRKTIQQKAEQILFDEGREPLIIPVVLEV